MITYRRTSLLESPAQTLVNTVNCVGVMGKGLAKAFKAREPDMFVRYASICADGLLEPGKLWLWRGAKSWTLNFPTKKHWKHPSKIEWVEAGLQKFVSVYRDQGIREISFPRLGCGNGGLDWSDVRPLMEKYLNKIDIPVFVHDFEKDIGLPEHLESICAEVASSKLKKVDFESFVKNLELVTKCGRGRLTTLGSNESFSATMKCEDSLLVHSNLSKWTFDLEDLHGAYRCAEVLAQTPIPLENNLQ
jgi:O-acetyl-ADP-ribose deacetylase (regulator of RNase III)